MCVISRRVTQPFRTHRVRLCVCAEVIGVMVHGMNICEIVMTALVAFSGRIYEKPRVSKVRQ